MLWRLFARSHIEDYLHGEDAWAVVTGSTDGIGKATANALLAKGFNVLIHGRNPTKLASTLSELKSNHSSRRIESVVADFNNLADVSNIPDYISSNNLRVTLFINNVATTDSSLFLFEEMLDKAVDVTLNAGVVFFTKLCSRVIPLLREVGGKAMMANIGSAAAESPIPYVAVYSGTKGYVLSFTRALATEAIVTSSNITYLYINVNSVSTSGNNSPETMFVPSTKKFADSLVFSIGRRSNRNRGSNVFITPYWGHELQRGMIGLLPRRMLEKFAIKTVEELKERIEKGQKRSD